MYGKGILVHGHNGRPRILDRQEFADCVEICNKNVLENSAFLPTNLFRKHCQSVKRTRISILDEDLPQEIAERTKRQCNHLIITSSGNVDRFTANMSLFE